MPKGQYSRKADMPISNDDLTAMLDMGLNVIRSGRAGAKYENSEAGLESFKERTIAYFEWIRDRGADAQERGQAIGVIPTVEGWATFLGVTRKTILKYSSERSEAWFDYITFIKNQIIHIKTVLAEKGQINSLVYFFDCANNGDSYVQANAVKIEVEKPKESGLTREQMLAGLDALPSKRTARITAAVDTDNDF